MPSGPLEFLNRSYFKPYLKLQLYRCAGCVKYKQDCCKKLKTRHQHQNAAPALSKTQVLRAEHHCQGQLLTWSGSISSSYGFQINHALKYALQVHDQLLLTGVLEMSLAFMMSLNPSDGVVKPTFKGCCFLPHLGPSRAQGPAYGLSPWACMLLCWTHIMARAVCWD